MYYEGQPYSRESAAAEIARLDADKDFVAAALGGDVAAQQLRRDFWLLARGIQPGGVSAVPADATGVSQQMTEREEQIHEAVLDTWAKHIPADDPVRRAQMARGLATADQINAAKHSIERAKRDPEFGRKVLANDMDAREKWASWQFVACHCREAPENYDWGKDGF